MPPAPVEYWVEGSAQEQQCQCMVCVLVPFVWNPGQGAAGAVCSPSPAAL
jgi:hypothetical protein